MAGRDLAAEDRQRAEGGYWRAKDAAKQKNDESAHDQLVRWVGGQENPRLDILQAAIASMRLGDYEVAHAALQRCPTNADVRFRLWHAEKRLALTDSRPPRSSRRPFFARTKTRQNVSGYQRADGTIVRGYVRRT